MFPLLTDKRDILKLSDEQLRLIPKIVLVRDFDRYVELLWNRLPDYIRADPEVQRCRVCLEHYNRPWQRTHIDGPAPLIKNCSECSVARDYSIRR